jgi:astacin (peptidase family M12A)
MLAAVPIVAGWASCASGAVAVANHDRLWFDHKVPFVICEVAGAADDASQPAKSGCDRDAAPLAAAEAVKVREAVAQWNQMFGSELQFVAVDSLGRHERGVLFSHSKEEHLCSTDQIGRPKKGRRTNVKIGAHCNGFAAAETPVGTVLHEMMHVAGFYHEQQRPDRDAYLKSHVPHGLVSLLFDVDDAGQWAKGNRHQTRMLTPYDFGSIMHYPIRDPRKAQLTLEGLERLDSQGLTINDPGRRDAMSANDIAGMKLLYGTQSLAAGQPVAKAEPAPL